jgi:hypothetical protein
MRSNEPGSNSGLVPGAPVWRARFRLNTAVFPHRPGKRLGLRRSTIWQKSVTESTVYGACHFLRAYE